MKRNITLTHEFVDFIPESLKDATIYISMRFATAAHKCCCGCGKEVVTPLSPIDWKLIFDGKTISLDPSIGNWSFECQSHYWIRNNKVRWADRWSQDEIDAGRNRDRLAKRRYFDTDDTVTTADKADASETPNIDQMKPGFWQWLRRWCKRL